MLKMDPNIDPEMHTVIESQFSKFSLPSHTFNGSNHSNHDEDYEHEQTSTNFSTFTSINDDQHSEGSAVEAAVAAAAVANMSTMINFNSLDENDAQQKHHQPSTIKPQSKLKPVNNNKQNQKSISFLNSLDLKSKSSQSSVSSLNPKQRLIHDSGSQVSIVVVNPASTEGSGRLGRPRKHTSMNSSSSENSSVNNLDKAMVSRFRVDNMPLSGPGSRGTRKKELPALISKDQTLKRKVQQVLKFDNFKKKKSIVSKSSEVIEVSSDSESETESTNKSKKTKSKGKPNPVEEEESLEFEDKDEETNLDLEDYDDVLELPITKANKPKTQILKPLKKRKEYPSPLTGLFTDAYENPNYNDSNKDSKLVALGFKVIPTPYAKDIVFILSFLNKFKRIFKNFPNLGPQDIEIGLKLKPSVKYPIKNVHQTFAKSVLYNEDIDGPQDQISEVMENLYLKMLSLAMNKNKVFTKSNIPKSSVELKDHILAWGLPKEWRDDSSVLKKEVVISISSEDDFEPLDPNHPENLEAEVTSYGGSFPLDNTPLDSDLFEIKGLAGLDPKDRLILLRSLVQWCLIDSKEIRDDVQLNIERQGYSEKETYYCSRYVKDGPNSIEFANNDLKVLQFKKKPTKAELELSHDPSSNPIKSPFFQRSVEFYAGDGGLAGRFYLCRTYSHEAGHLLNGKDIESLSNKAATDLLSLEQPSKFKLYIQDLATTLSKQESTETILDPWYEVAADTQELTLFIDFIAEKLQDFQSKGLKHLLEYLNAILPVLQKFEHVQANYQPRSTRASRRKPLNNLQEQEDTMKKLVDYDMEGSNSDDSEEGENVEQEENQKNEDSESDGIEFLGGIEEGDDDDYNDDE